jgi:16S rRNA processing protein RimM
VPPATPEPEDIVVMGRIMAPHGVRGWVKIRPVSETPAALLDYKNWWVRDARGSKWREVRQTAGRMHSGVLLVAISGVATREEALLLRGADVGVSRSALPRAKKDEIYWVDSKVSKWSTDRALRSGTLPRSLSTARIRCCG